MVCQQVQFRNGVTAKLNPFAKSTGQQPASASVADCLRTKMSFPKSGQALTLPRYKVSLQRLRNFFYLEVAANSDPWVRCFAAQSISSFSFLITFSGSGQASRDEFNWSDSFDESEDMKTILKSSASTTLRRVWRSLLSSSASLSSLLTSFFGVFLLDFCDVLSLAALTSLTRRGNDRVTSAPTTTTPFVSPENETKIYCFES